MYFIGDSVLSSVQRFSVGAASQMNDAHIVDFYGAMPAVWAAARSMPVLSSVPSKVPVWK